MKRFFSMMALVLCLVSTFVFSSCSSAEPDATHEAVWVIKPWFFGHGGIDHTPVSTGLEYGALSSSPVYFSIVPTRYDEAFDDIFSNDNTPLDFNSYITIQIKKGKTPILLENYGTDWYANNIQVPYRNFTREEVSKYSPFDLISNREILREIDNAVTMKMETLVKQLSVNAEFPIIIKSIVTGAAKPNKNQLAEMNRTAAAIQRKQTEQRNKEMEEARAAAEKAKAIADKAYQEEMGLTSAQFIQLKYIEMIAAKPDANIDVLVGGGETPMWNIRR